MREGNECMEFFFWAILFLARMGCFIALRYLMFAVCGGGLFMSLALEWCMDRSRIQPVILLHRVVRMQIPLWLLRVTIFEEDIIYLG